MKLNSKAGGVRLPANKLKLETMDKPEQPYGVLNLNLNDLSPKRREEIMNDLNQFERVMISTESHITTVTQLSTRDDLKRFWDFVDNVIRLPRVDYTETEQDEILDTFYNQGL
jgi:hypothetical protein